MDENTIQALKSSEEKYRKMIKYANDAIFAIDPDDGTILYANLKAEQMCQTKKNDLIGKKVWDLHPIEEHDMIKNLFAMVVESGKGYNSELNIKRGDGTTIAVDVSSAMISYGDKKVIQRICHDITNRKKLEHENEKWLEGFKYIMDMMPVGFGVRTNAGEKSIIEFENKKLKEMFHPEGNDHDHNHDHWKLIDGCEKSKGDTMVDENGIYVEEHQLDDGRIFQFTLNYVRDINNIWREIQIVRDVTKRRKLEKELVHSKENLEHKVLERTKELKEKQTQLAQAEKMAALGNLVAGVAHEINTPMGALKSNNDMFIRLVQKIKESINFEGLDKDSPNYKNLSKYFENIDQLNEVSKNASERIVKIISSLRNFARLDQADKDSVDIHEGLESTLTLIHHQLKNRIEIVKEYNLHAKVNCYPNQINQVFINILVNASQAISGNGTIIIKTYQDKHNAIIELTDNGKGISKEHINKIFDPGFTTKGVGVGTGLGLSIVHQIVTNHSGQIEIDSELDKGTTFTISLPIR